MTVATEKKTLKRQFLRQSKWVAVVIYLIALGLMIKAYPAPSHWLWIIMGGLAGGWFALIWHRQRRGKI